MVNDELQRGNHIPRGQSELPQNLVRELLPTIGWRYSNPPPGLGWRSRYFMNPSIPENGNGNI
ncbi:hypothetical protein HYX00_05130 [Candidatus Woesearchaeota archaeon]|nr:hypothetical protein [Candidatus Woesearchaeota archaeon]